MRLIRPTTRRPGVVVIFLLVALALAACAGSSAQLAPVGEAVGDTGGESYGRGEGEVPAGQPAAPLPAATDGGGEQPGDGVGARDDAKIIRTGTMELEVSDVPAAVRAARGAILGMGGYIGASRTYNQGDEPFAEITYRIPVSRWEDALDALRSLTGVSTKVIAEQTEAVDVTGQVADLDARIRNLRASETALVAIAEQATRISDVLEVQARITEVRGQIEQLEAQQADLADRTSYATLAVTFRLPTVAAIEIQAEAWDPARIFDEATASLVGILQTLAGAGIWLAIVWLPILVVVGVLAAVFVRFLRRLGVFDRPMRTVPPALPTE